MDPDPSQGTPATRPPPLSPEDLPTTGDAKNNPWPRKNLFDTDAPTKPPPSQRTIPQTARITPPSPPASAADLTDVKDFVKTQIGDLHSQVNSLSQQLSILMSMWTQQQASTEAAANNGSASAVAVNVSKSQGDAQANATSSQGDTSAKTENAASSQGGQTYLQAASPSTSAAVHRPSSVLLSDHQFRESDPEMYENCKDLKPRPLNPSLAVSALSKIKPTVLKAVQNIKQPGLEADIALSTFLSEARAVLSTPANHTMAAILIEALTTGSAKADSATQNLLRLAVKCGSAEMINMQIAQIRQTGRYDRSMAALADVTKDPSYVSFDPRTIKGRDLWATVLNLLLAYWQRQKSCITDQLELESKYAQLACDDPADMSAHLTAEAELYTKLESAHVIYSDHQRIRAILSSCSKPISQDYQSFKKRMQQDNKWSYERDTDVNLFAQDLEQVADAMEPEQIKPQQPTPRSTRKQDKQDKQGKQEAPSAERPCWNHQNLFEGCNRPDCIFEHVGEKAAKALQHANEDGICRRFLAGECDKGDQCKFKYYKAA
jgi:hypothetical protein